MRKYFKNNKITEEKTCSCRGCGNRNNEQYGSILPLNDTKDTIPPLCAEWHIGFCGWLVSNWLGAKNEETKHKPTVRKHVHNYSCSANTVRKKSSPLVSLIYEKSNKFCPKNCTSTTYKSSRYYFPPISNGTKNEIDSNRTRCCRICQKRSQRSPPTFQNRTSYVQTHSYCCSRFFEPSPRLRPESQLNGTTKVLKPVHYRYDTQLTEGETKHYNKNDFCLCGHCGEKSKKPVLDQNEGTSEVSLKDACCDCADLNENNGATSSSRNKNIKKPIFKMKKKKKNYKKSKKIKKASTIQLLSKPLPAQCNLPQSVNSCRYDPCGSSAKILLDEERCKSSINETTSSDCYPYYFTYHAPSCYEIIDFGDLDRQCKWFQECQTYSVDIYDKMDSFSNVAPSMQKTDSKVKALKDTWEAFLSLSNSNAKNKTTVLFQKKNFEKKVKSKASKMQILNEIQGPSGTKSEVENVTQNSNLGHYENIGSQFRKILYSTFIENFKFQPLPGCSINSSKPNKQQLVTWKCNKTKSKQGYTFKTGLKMNIKRKARQLAINTSSKLKANGHQIILVCPKKLNIIIKPSDFRTLGIN